MISVANFYNNYYERLKEEPRKTVVYGAGTGIEQLLHEVKGIYCIVDKRADEIREVEGLPVCFPEKLTEIGEPIYIIISVKNKSKCEDIVQYLKTFEINALIFYFVENIAFGYSFWNTAKAYTVTEKEAPLKVNIVCSDTGWIFRKFADRIYASLEIMGIQACISPEPRDDVDINHHIPYIAWKPNYNDTLMITHVDNGRKIELLKKQLKIAGMGICMSKDTMDRLSCLGVSREKLCYINPAHDGVIKPKKYVMGITHRCYDKGDLRKRATALLDIVQEIDPKYFKFFIMGAGWDQITESMRQMGFEVEYYPEFLYDLYNEKMQMIDYFLYMGFDEGTMGFLDAMAAGAGTIVTPQGYHLDTDCPIDYPCRTVQQFKDALLDLQHKREKRVKAVEDWTWDNYVRKHVEIWNYLLRRKELTELCKNQLNYEDGIFSVLLEDNRL